MLFALFCSLFKLPGVKVLLDKKWLSVLLIMDYYINSGTLAPKNSKYHFLKVISNSFQEIIVKGLEMKYQKEILTRVFLNWNKMGMNLDKTIMSGGTAGRITCAII